VSSQTVGVVVFRVWLAEDQAAMRRFPGFLRALVLILVSSVVSGLIAGCPGARA